MQRERIQPNYGVFLCVEQKILAKGCHKLAPTTSDPYLVKAVQNQTVAILIQNKSTEKVSRYHIALESKPQPIEELKNAQSHNNGGIWTNPVDNHLR